MGTAQKKMRTGFLCYPHAVQFHVHGTCCIATVHLDQGLAVYKPVSAGHSLVGSGIFDAAVNVPAGTVTASIPTLT